jgi:nitroimidazol reductase NimA-like FMN-containing flavoprotein (pyridoxamine 5'-phosphate oxidase superfamily)
MTKNQTNLSKNVIQHAEKPRDEIRQKEYAVVEEAWIKALLTRGAFGTLATVHGKQPFLNPILFLYIEADHAIYFHGAYVGRMRANISINPNVCFNVNEIGRILPDKKAAEFGVEYNSVTVFGRAEMINDEKETERLLQGLMDKYAPHLKPNQDYTPAQPEDIKRTLVCKINIEDWTGKQLTDDGETIDPYYYPHLPVIRHPEQ